MREREEKKNKYLLCEATTTKKRWNFLKSGTHTQIKTQNPFKTFVKILSDDTQSNKLSKLKWLQNTNKIKISDNNTPLTYKYYRVLRKGWLFLRFLSKL